MSTFVNKNQNNFNNISPIYMQNNVGNNKNSIHLNNIYGINNDKIDEYQEKKLEDIKNIGLDNIDEILEITYKTYKKEFVKDRSFSIEANEEINDEINVILNEFEKKIKKRNDNLTDSLLSEILDDIEFSEYTKDDSHNREEKIKLNEKKIGKSNVNSNSKYINKTSNKTPHLNSHIYNQKRVELNIELPEEDRFSSTNNFINNANNLNSIPKRSESTTSDISNLINNINAIPANNIEMYLNKKNSNISNTDSELNLNINMSDSKMKHNESYNEKNLQTEDFNLSYSEVNIRQNASRISKQEISGVYSNDVSLSHQSVFRNSLISRNPSFVLNKFQFFSNDDNDIDNFNFKHRVSNNDFHHQNSNSNNMMRNSLGQSQNELPSFVNTNKISKNNLNVDSNKNTYPSNMNNNSNLNSSPVKNFHVNKSIEIMKNNEVLTPINNINKSNIGNNQNANNSPFLPTLDDILNYNDNQKNSNNQEDQNNMKDDRGYEPNSINSQNHKLPSDMSTYSHKFLSVSKNLSNSLSQDENILNKNSQIESYFERITNFKQLNIKNYYFETKINFFDLNTDDPFLESFITLFEKNNFMNLNKIKFILNDYPNRYEIHFFDMIFKYLDLKKHIFTNLNHKNILILKNQIIETITAIKKRMEKKQFLLNDNFNLNNLNNNINNNFDFFIFKPILLLKFWDNSTEDNYLHTYQELNKLFLIKTYIKTKENIKAFDELSDVMDEESVYINSHLFLYYFGKIIAQLIARIDKISDRKILEFLDKDKIENYNKIKRILREFGQPNSYNYKKRAKNYENLAKISEYFGVDQKKIEIFNKRAKKYMEYYNDPSKLTLTKENKTGRDSTGSL